MELRAQSLSKLSAETLDVLVVGGGINGAVTAACLSARGAKVGLVDRTDFACTTSQSSSNLAWGGIKYMESYDFGLVWKLCGSRNELCRAYPSAVRPIRFYTTHEKSFRHGLFSLQVGTWAYWFLGRGYTETPRRLSRETMAKEEPVVRLDGVDGGVEYTDAYFPDNDARFVWGFVRRALDSGAAAANYVESLGSVREDDGLWTTRLRDRRANREFSVRSRALVNACGPYADAHNGASGVTTKYRHVFSKGIHLIVPRITESERVLTFFADDGRPFFVIPMGPCTCIGTTDTPVDAPETEVTPEDRRFVLENINKRLVPSAALTEADIVAERCGVRPLVVSGGEGGSRDWLELSRKHVVELDAARAHVTIYGGKLTDCLNVGEEVAVALRKAGVSAPSPKAPWYGEPDAETRAAIFDRAKAVGLDALTAKTSREPLSERLYRRYGRDASEVIEAIAQDPRLAAIAIEGTEHVRAEVSIAAKRDMIVTLDDFLRRRSKIALVVRREDLARSKGLAAAARVLFGERADAELEAYFGASAAHDEPTRQRASRDAQPLTP
jgi:glycerol-3-phosphate dehydrogenase